MNPLTNLWAFANVYLFRTDPKCCGKTLATKTETLMTTTARRTLKFAVLFSALTAGVVLTGDAAPQKPQKAAPKGKTSTGSYSAALVFPAKKVFDPNKGTVEMIFSPAYSAEDNMGAGSGMRTFSVLTVCGPKGSGRGEDGLGWFVWVGQWQTRNYLSISSSLFERQIPYEPAINYFSTSFTCANGQPFKAGEWYSFAASWARTGTNYVLALYFDGKCASKTKMPISSLFGTADVDPKDLLIIGDPRVMRGSLESLRISKRERTAEEIEKAGKAGLVNDADTLLFVDADTVLKMKSKSAEDLINKEERIIRVPPEGTLFGRVKQVAGRTGKAVEFPR